MVSKWIAWGVASRATSDTAHFFGFNKKTIVFAVVGLVGTPLFGYFAGWDAVKEEMWAKVTLGLAPFGALAVLLFSWNLARASVLVRRVSKPDYWRCPDGRLHQWRYLGNQQYICENCPMATDKATLKANTDAGPQMTPDQV